MFSSESRFFSSEHCEEDVVLLVFRAVNSFLRDVSKSILMQSNSKGASDPPSKTNNFDISSISYVMDALRFRDINSSAATMGKSNFSQLLGEAKLKLEMQRQKPGIRTPREQSL
jgi:hypothetical protein